MPIFIALSLMLSACADWGEDEALGRVGQPTSGDHSAPHRTKRGTWLPDLGGCGPAWDECSLLGSHQLEDLLAVFTNDVYEPLFPMAATSYLTAPLPDEDWSFTCEVTWQESGTKAVTASFEVNQEQFFESVTVKDCNNRVAHETSYWHTRYGVPTETAEVVTEISPDLLYSGDGFSLTFKKTHHMWMTENCPLVDGRPDCEIAEIELKQGFMRSGSWDFDRSPPDEYEIEGDGMDTFITRYATGEAHSYLVHEGEKYEPLSIYRYQKNDLRFHYDTDEACMIGSGAIYERKMENRSRLFTSTDGIILRRDTDVGDGGDCPQERRVKVTQYGPDWPWAVDPHAMLEKSSSTSYHEAHDYDRTNVEVIRLYAKATHKDVEEIIATHSKNGVPTDGVSPIQVVLALEAAEKSMLPDLGWRGTGLIGEPATAGDCRIPDPQDGKLWGTKWCVP